MRTLDVFVVAYHALEALADMLASLALYSRTGYRLTVFENGDKNYPLSWLWNRFVRQSQRDLIALLNPDIILGPGWDTEAELCLTEHGDCGAAGRITNHPPQYELVPKMLPPNVSISDVLPLTNRVRRGAGDRRFLFTKDERMTPHHCIVFPRAVWAKIDGYDERLPFAGNDYDFNARIIRAGMNLAVCTHAMSFHKGGVSTREAVARGAFNVQKNCPKFSRPPSNTDFPAL